MFPGRLRASHRTRATVLVASYLGYESVEVAADSRTGVEIRMQESSKALDAVVVTALGIKRSEKALSYNVQGVKGEDMNIVKDANFMNSLAGKVAGVSINASAGGVGGATRVVMRGTKSISGNNNALYVIDGVPILNVTGGSVDSEYGLAGGEGISDINPEDIESVNVLTDLRPRRFTVRRQPTAWYSSTPERAVRGNPKSRSATIRLSPALL